MRLFYKHVYIIQEDYVMLNEVFKGIFETSATPAIQVGQFLLCLIISLFIGIFLAVVYTYKNNYTQSFVITLALIPAIVCVVILLVNGNIGAGVAVAGAFNLVRFRSVAGSAKEICAIFLAMGAGLTAGMGYLGYAILFSLILALGNLLYTQIGFGVSKKAAFHKTLHITIPEDLDYTHVFDEILNTYTSKCNVLNVKTTNMGSLFKLTYQITLKDLAEEKKFIDELRCRNGNLEISLSHQETTAYEL